ncbi:Glucose/ribitol dehydrogenase [Penicillium maclennaniae]|uniref:Glucose/ribitol dehydrogenase n=1 Tax=Penicillium maclennaniae TaxID=1343394 RepID=UPI00253F923F|nr:Glucose/ribitol dehydrogenase [Penicillium maclennaniae]KAJ5670582.1 Glucose/ribitol dehydrogenase [Penicillium maclennaniae]
MAEFLQRLGLNDEAKQADYLRLLGLNNGAAIASYVKEHHDTDPFITPSGQELAGKSVFLTGVSKGIGRETAIRCAEAGCEKLAIAARSSLDDVVKQIENNARKAGRNSPQTLALQVDVASEESVRTAAQTVSEAFDGKLDILINNAGYLPEFKPMTDSDPSDGWKGMEINVKGTFLCSHYLLPLVLKSDTKVVINITSHGASFLTQGGSSYCASKLAVGRLTEFLASDYRDQNLIAISVHPGVVKTDMRYGLPEALRDALIDDASLPADTIV